MSTLFKFLLRLDESTLKGMARVTGTAKPAIGFDLSLDHIDLDAYLPVAAPAPASAASADSGDTTARVPVPAAAAGDPSGSPPAEAAALPLEAMRALNLDGKLKIGELRVAGLTTSDLALQVHAADGLITLAPVALSLYGGHYNGTVVLDARNAALETRLTGKLTAVQIGPLLKDLNGRESLSGTAAVDADLRLSGNHPRAMTNS